MDDDADGEADPAGLEFAGVRFTSGNTDHTTQITQLQDAGLEPSSRRRSHGPI